MPPKTPQNGHVNAAASAPVQSTVDLTETVRTLLGERFSNEFDNPTAMMDAFVRHNEAVRTTIPAHRLLEWTATDGWEPICERLGVDVPDEPFPRTNDTNQWRADLGMPPL